MRNAKHSRVGFGLFNSSVVFKPREIVVPANRLLNNLHIGCV